MVFICFVYLVYNLLSHCTKTNAPIYIGSLILLQKGYLSNEHQFHLYNCYHHPGPYLNTLTSMSCHQPTAWEKTIKESHLEHLIEFNIMK